MKKVLNSMLLFFALTAITNCLTAQAVATAGATIDFKKEVHDYGTVKYGSDRTCTFDFTNNGNAPLIISNAKGSCGCTVPSWPKEPIAPGETATITVNYDTKRPGQFTKKITITSNAVNAPTKELEIKGNVLEKPEDAAPVNKSGAPSVN